jgi:hypothetical protein
MSGMTGGVAYELLMLTTAAACFRTSKVKSGTSAGQAKGRSTASRASHRMQAILGARLRARLTEIKWAPALSRGMTEWTPAFAATRNNAPTP